MPTPTPTTGSQTHAAHRHPQYCRRPNLRRPEMAADTAGEEELVRTLARDVNCLQDPDRMTRRRALDNLNSALLPGGGGQSPSPAAVCGFVQHHLLEPLLQVIEQDAVEKCRELALNIVHAVVLLQQQQQPPPAGDDAGLSTLTAAFLPIAKRRIGVAPFQEPTEELRLAILQVLTALLSTPAGWPSVLKSKAALFPDLAAVLARELTDSFPEAKREACHCLGLAARYAPQALRLQQSVLLPPLLGNLGHQQSKVRQASLQALGHLLEVGNDAMARVVTDSVLPALKKLVFDRAPVLRKELVGVVGGWLQQGEEDEEEEIEEDVSSCPPYYFQACEADLVFILLLGLSDDTPEVVDATKQRVQAVGKAWVRRKQRKRLVYGPSSSSSSEANNDDDDDDNTNPDGSPQEGAQVMVRGLLSSLLPKVLDDVGHWTLRMRHRSVLLLADVLRLAGPALVAFLPPTIATLINAALDEEPEVGSAVGEAAQALGEGVEVSVLLDELLPLVRGARGVQMAERAAALFLLRSILTGAAAAAAGGGGGGGETTRQRKEILSNAEMEVLTRSLVDPSVLGVEDPNEAALIAPPLAYVLLAIVEAALQPCEATSCQYRLLRVALQLLAFSLSEEGGGAVRGQVNRVLKLLAGCAGGSEADDEEKIALLWERHFEALLQEVVVGAESWRKDSAGRMVFDTLVRESIQGAARHLDQILAVITPHVVVGSSGGNDDENGREEESAQQAELRLAQLLLLETLIDRSLPIAAGVEEDKAGERRTRQLLRDLLLPTIVWRAGRAAATVRKVGLVCLYRLLREGEAGRLPRLVLLEVAPSLLPVLQTNLEDYDATSRHLVALSMSSLFEAYRAAENRGGGASSSSSSSSSSSFSLPSVQQLLPELVKRLDDASNDVRQASCQALVGLFDLPGVRALLPLDSILRGAVDQLLVHLDDADCAEAVSVVLERVCVALGPEARAMVVEEASKGVHAKRLLERLDGGKS